MAAVAPPPGFGYEQPPEILGTESQSNCAGLVPKRFQSRQFHQSNRPAASGTDPTNNGDLAKETEDSNQYQVKTTGLVHSIMILRLLFGHPDFFDQILNRFNIISSNDDEEGEDNGVQLEQNYMHMSAD